MYCIEWSDDEPVEVYGYEHEEDYSRLDVALLPCNYLHTDLGYQGDSIHPECVGDLNDQISYLGPSHMIIYMNQERLNPYKNKDDMIERYSEIKSQQFNEYTPSWIDSKVLITEFTD